MKSEIQEITLAIRKFRDDRDWKQFHDPKNLAISLNIESSELLEAFLWKSPEEANIDAIKNELADVFYNAFLIADTYDFDVKEIVFAKLKANDLKYPIEKVRGSNKKYDEI